MTNLESEVLQLISKVNQAEGKLAAFKIKFDIQIEINEKLLARLEKLEEADALREQSVQTLAVTMTMHNVQASKICDRLEHIEGHINAWLPSTVTTSGSIFVEEAQVKKMAYELSLLKGKVKGFGEVLAKHAAWLTELKNGEAAPDLYPEQYKLLNQQLWEELHGMLKGGHTDASPYLKAALLTSDTVKIPKGTFSISETLNPDDLAGNKTIQGAGTDQTFMNFSAAIGNPSKTYTFKAAPLSKTKKPKKPKVATLKINSSEWLEAESELASGMSSEDVNGMVSDGTWNKAVTDWLIIPKTKGKLQKSVDAIIAQAVSEDLLDLLVKDGQKYGDYDSAVAPIPAQDKPMVAAPGQDLDKLTEENVKEDGKAWIQPKKMPVTDKNVTLPGWEKDSTGQWWVPIKDDPNWKEDEPPF